MRILATVVVLRLLAPAFGQGEELSRLVPKLSDAEVRVRENAQRELEALVRRGGQKTFDILETVLLPKARDPRNPTPEERQATMAKVALFQEIFESH